MYRIEVGMNSPWGQIQAVDTIEDGVYAVYTASHGGIMVRDDVAVYKLSAPAYEHKTIVITYLDRGPTQWLCYEEDCDWAIPCFELDGPTTEKMWGDSYLVVKCSMYTALLRWHREYLHARGINADSMQADLDRMYMHIKAEQEECTR